VEAKGDSRYFKVLGICNDVFLVDMFFDKFFTDFDSSLSSSSIIVLPDFSEDPSLNDSAYSCDGQKLANDTIDYPVKEGLQVELKSLKRKIEVVSADVPCLKNEEFNKLAKF
ncbi:hypothetical protein L195_g058554, partial [Trifolium pratense]